MRILYALSLMLALSVGPSALAQQTNLEARYVKACMKDGDTDAFCRCEFANTRKAVKDDKELAWVVDVSEKVAGQSEEQVGAILKQLPPEQLQRIMAWSEELEPLSKKCPDYKEKK